jgi:hypothetical protein
MSEATDSSAPVSGAEEPAPVSRSSGKGKKFWLMIAAVIVAIALVATALMVAIPSGKKLTAEIKGDATLVVEAGATERFTVVVKLGKTDVSNNSDLTVIKWSVSPVTLGGFSRRALPTVPFVAGLNGGSGTVTCTIVYNDDKTVIVTKPITVNPPFLDAVSVTPSKKTIEPGTNYTFRAAAVSSVGLPLSGISFTWNLTGNTDVLASLVPPLGLNATTGSSVRLAVDDVLGNLSLSATASYAGLTKTGNSSITVGFLPPRSMDFLWYDMFNVPVPSWYAKREEIYNQEIPYSMSSPWWFLYNGDSGGLEGNLYTYALMRLNITGANVSEVNMNERPEFLPVLSPTEMGGTAEIDWYMQYLTKDQLNASYGIGIANQYDGWIVDLNGTVLLDKQAAKTVLNLTDVGWNSFPDWWDSHKNIFNEAYSDWLVNEAEGRVDIENAYESYYQLFTINIEATKVNDSILLKYDILTWGMETLFLRWLYEVFLPIEMWYEDFNFHATIMPEYSKIDIDTAVTYALWATETLNRDVAGNEKGDPCWTFQPLKGDAVVSTIEHPHSDFDVYSTQKYRNFQTGSTIYGEFMDYDVVPSAWNLTDNETLKFVWPDGPDVMFKYHVAQNISVNVSDEMVCVYSEPNQTDFPGQVVMDNVNNSVEFTGPIDMWDWSKNQTTHTYLQAEWGRLGLLPYGIPTVEFKKKTPVVLYLDDFVIEATTPIPALDKVTVTVRAIDQYDNTYYDYNGTVNFTSSDSLSSMPANYTFKPGFAIGADAGVHTFNCSTVSSTTVFKTPGAQTLTVTNVSVDHPVSKTKSMMIDPVRTADSIEVDVYHVPSVGVVEDVTLSVYDQYGDLFLNYTGEVSFSTNKTGQVTLPNNYVFQVTDAGVHKIVGELNFTAVGWFTITATDTVVATVTGSQTNINVSADPEVVDHFTVSGIKSMLQRQKSDVRVVAYQQYGIVFERYNGTIHFSVNDTEGNATFPADYTFLVSDKGVKVFEKGVMFDPREDVVLTVYVADTVVTIATGQQNNILIQYKPASETFRMYDMLKQPWGEWWPWRYKGWTTDIILNNETGKYTMLYNADKNGRQGVIYAPYRWNITGANMSSVSISNPEFMPVLGNPNVPGAAASLNVYFEYLDTDWWYGYWSPYWKFPNTIFEDGHKTDGYYLGVLYNVVMNRQAAESWMGMPQTANPDNWWITHASSYIKAWSDWITNEGSTRLDIWAGYEWGYTDMGLKMKMKVLPNGDIHLEIGEISWGYEVLLTRWFTETQLCNHEPYYEDGTLSVTYYPQWIDFTFDAVCQYSLHAVKANESATNEGAWVWEPQLIDYMDSSNGHPTKFDPWATETYQSWNAGDPQFSQEAGYDSGLQYFNLTDYQTFIIQLPTGNDVLGYLAEPMWRLGRQTSITKVITGVPSTIGHVYDVYPRGDGTNYNYEEYWPLMYNGTMSLGWYGNWTGAPYLVYDPVAKTITMQGPMSFDNTYHTNGALYRGAPWIEFNVTPVVGGTSLPTPEASSSGTISAEMVSLLSIITATSMAVVAVVSRKIREK